jgi:Glycosyl hydrolase family 59
MRYQIVPALLLRLVAGWLHRGEHAPRPRSARGAAPAAGGGGTLPETAAAPGWFTAGKRGWPYPDEAGGRCLNKASFNASDHFPSDPITILTQAGAATATTVSGTSAGRTFGGIGAISGGGGNSRLLTDYPAAEQTQMLDYLFKPGYGADLQILKVEIGGDTNSTDGSESSIEHSRGSINCGAGYNWWLMEQAKALNPAIKLYGLAWGAPGWISGGFWSTDTINYLVSWLNCAKSHGLTIDYLGGWNERGYRTTPTA